MVNITEILPDDMPEWANDGIDSGQFFRVCLSKVATLEDKVKRLEADFEELEEREIQLVNTLENGIGVICSSIGISTDKYDCDEADICCYANCFNDAAELLKKSGCGFDFEENAFIPDIY